MLRTIAFIASFVTLTVFLVFIFVALGDVFVPGLMDLLANDVPKEKLFIRSIYIYFLFFPTSATLSLMVTVLLFRRRR